jgi:hypothetical protein
MTTLFRNEPTGLQGAGLAYMIRAFLAVLVAFVYSGAFLFLSPNSQVILYGFYSVLLMLVLLYIYVARGLPNVRLMLPYLIWLLLYGVWGTLISPINQAILPDTLRLLFRNGILLLACTVVLMDRRSLGILIRWIEVAVILNALIAIYEAIDPTLITTITFIVDPYSVAFDVLRPAGLWINPDLSAMAFLFAILISVWDRGILAWLGRIASVIGIYLSASRGGIYVFVICMLVILVFHLRAMFIADKRRQSLMISMLSFALALQVGLFTFLLPGSVDISNNWSFNRILDFSEQTTPTGYTRLQLASAALDTAFAGPLQGYGIFAFQRADLSSELLFDTKLGALQIGAHNIYLAVLGEVSVVGLLGYLLAFAVGLARMLQTKTTAMAKLILTLLWFTYLLAGFFDHSHITDPLSQIYLCFLFCLPSIVVDAQYRSPESASTDTLNMVAVR